MSVVRRGSVLLTPEQVAAVWQLAVQPVMRDGTLRNARIPSALRSAAADLHAAHREHEADRERTIPAPRDPNEAAWVSTEEAARRLGVDPRSARRIFKHEGVTRLRRNRWPAEEVAAIATARRP